MKRITKARGYIMLVVLCILALLAIAVAAELASSGADAGASTRSVEDERARATAEACLDMMQAYADDYMRAYLEWNRADQLSFGEREAEIDHAPYFDFDGLLDPDAALDGFAGAPRHDGDEHVPVFAKTIYLPKNIVDEAHRWGIVDLGAGARCLVRVEDNSDDGFFTASASYFSSGVDEGCDLNTENGKTARCPRQEVTDRDNDGAVFLSVVGLFPVPPGTPDADAYDTAHARVGIRRLTSRAEKADLEGELLNSKVQVELAGATELCGRGGVNATDFVMAPTACACGQLKAQSYTPLDPPDTGCGCATCNAITKDPLAAPLRAFDTTVVSFTTTVPPRIDPIDYSEVAGKQVCGFYQQGDLFYVFDRSDGDARNQGGLPVTCLPGSKCADQCVTSSGGEFDLKSFGAPCTWQLDPAAGPSVTCDVGQSPCWKPIAKLGGLGTIPDVWLGPMPAGASRNWVAGPDEVAFRAGEPIPNVKSGEHFGGSSPFCGRKDVCDDCDSVTPALKVTGGRVETADDLSSFRMPVPADLFIDTGGRDVVVKKTGRGTIRVPLTIVTNGAVHVDRHASLCCSLCDCVDQPNPPECYFEFDASGPAGGEFPAGTAIKSSRECDVDSDGYITGDIDCKAVKVTSDLCLHGDIDTYSNSLLCRGDPAATCIDGGNEVGIFGQLQSAGSVMSYARRKTELDFGVTADGKVIISGGALRLGASIEANGKVLLDNVGDVVDTDPSGFTVKRVLTYSETTW